MKTPQTKTIKREDLDFDLHFLAQNHLFSILFIKKNGELRKMQCRFGVHKGVKGTGQSYAGPETNLMLVWEFPTEGFKYIDKRRVVAFKTRGTTYHLEDANDLLLKFYKIPELEAK